MIKVKKDIDNWDWKFDPKLVIPVVNTTEIEKKLVVGDVYKRQLYYLASIDQF